MEYTFEDYLEINGLTLEDVEENEKHYSPQDFETTLQEI